MRWCLNHTFKTWKQLLSNMRVVKYTNFWSRLWLKGWFSCQALWPLSAKLLIILGPVHLDLGFHGPGTVRWLKRVAAQERGVCEMPTARRAAKKVWGWGLDGDSRTWGTTGCWPRSPLEADFWEEGFGGDWRTGPPSLWPKCLLLCGV